MKLILTVLGGLFLIASLYSQPLKFDTVLVFENQPKEKLYSLSKLFIAENFKSANDVIQLDDKESGMLLSKGNFDYQFLTKPRFTCTTGNGKGIVEFSMKIEIKENKLRLSFYNFKHVSIDPYVDLGEIEEKQEYSNSCKDDIYNDIVSKSKALFLSATHNIQESFQKNNTNSDW